MDFKFGKKNEAYRAQVQEYMDLLTLMGYSSITRASFGIFHHDVDVHVVIVYLESTRTDYRANCTGYRPDRG